MPSDSDFPFVSVDPSQWWRTRALPRILVQPNAPPNGASTNPASSDGIDDWFVPTPASSPTDHPNDWSVPARVRTDTSFPDDWIYPNNSNAPTPDVAPTKAPPAPNPQSSATTPSRSNRSLPPPDPLAAFWSLIPASRAGAMAWHPPVFLSPNPFSHENIPASAWVTPPPIFLNSSGQFPSAGPAPPNNPPSAAADSLLGGIGKMLAAAASSNFLHDSAGQGVLGGVAKMLAASASRDPLSTPGSSGLLGALANLRLPPSSAQADASFAPDLRPFLPSASSRFGDGDLLPDIELVADKKKGQQDPDFFNGRAFGKTPPLGSVLPRLLPPIVGGPPPLAQPARATPSPSGVAPPSPGPAVTNPRSFGSTDRILPK